MSLAPSQALFSLPASAPPDLIPHDELDIQDNKWTISLPRGPFLFRLRTCNTSDIEGEYLGKNSNDAGLNRKTGVHNALGLVRKLPSGIVPGVDRPTHFLERDGIHSGRTYTSGLGWTEKKAGDAGSRGLRFDRSRTPTLVRFAGWR